MCVFVCGQTIESLYLDVRCAMHDRDYGALSERAEPLSYNIRNMGAIRIWKRRQSVGGQ